MDIFHDVVLSQKAAQAVQGMPSNLRDRFIKALKQADKVSDLPDDYKNYLNNGYKPDKVMPTLEQALKSVVIEWEN